MLSEGVLKGDESQRLRIFATSNRMEPSRDLDHYGTLLATGTLESVKDDFARRRAIILKRTNDQKPDEVQEIANKAVAEQLYQLRWGPTSTPMFNLLSLFAQIWEPNRARYLAIAGWLMNTAKVPVDGTDVGGNTALQHAVSTKPSFDTEYGQMLYDAGANINHRNRYGATVASEMAMVHSLAPEDIRKAKAAIPWFLHHGGNLDVKDGDGISARSILRIASKWGGPSIPKLIEQEEERRKALRGKCCGFCGRQDAPKLMK